jgi:hypothetical protein
MAAAGPNEGGGSGSGGETGDVPAGDAPGTTSDSPITVLGSPMGISQGPHCAESGTRLFFDAVSLAITGQTDDLGRLEILVRSGVHTQLLNGPPEPFSSSMVSFVNPDDPGQSYGSTAPIEGCVFARAYAPPEAAGKIVRLTASMNICSPADPISSVGDTAVAARFFGGSALGGPSYTTASMDFVIPEKTVDTSLPDCGATDWTDWRNHLNDEYQYQQMMEKRIERHQQNNSDSPETTRFGRELIQRPAF